MKKWTIDDSRELYNINGWGTSYFGVNDKGDMYVTPCKDNVQIDLRDVMDELQLRDVTPPVLLRFRPAERRVGTVRRPRWSPHQSKQHATNFIFIVINIT